MGSLLFGSYGVLRLELLLKGERFLKRSVIIISAEKRR